MHPRAPKMLSRLCGIANEMIRAQDSGALRPNPARSVELGQVYGELVVMRDYIGDCGFDETAIMLTQCLIHLDNYAAPLGDAELATKWRYLAKSFLGFVQVDAAVAIEARPSTTDHDFVRKS